MQSLVDNMLSTTKAELRLFPSSQKSIKSASDRQKLYVSTVQEVVRHLADSIRGEYRDRIMVRNANLRLYNLALQKFERFQTSVRYLFAYIYALFVFIVF